MHLDASGLPISTASGKAAAAYDFLVIGYLTQRADTPARLTALLGMPILSAGLGSWLTRRLRVSQ